MSGSYLLKGAVQHYDWGGTQFIPALLGGGRPDLLPYAELWFGVHPKGPTRVEGTEETLAEHLSAEEYELPFLLKVLDVRSSLSIQVHPDKQQAEQGFIRENRQGISLQAGERNYKDANHKPEVMVALTPCALLYGFSEVDAIIERCRPFSSLAPLIVQLQTDGLAAVYARVMRLSKAELEPLLTPLLAELLPLWRSGRLSGDEHPFWLARAASEHGGELCLDPGLLAILMMNLVLVAPGEAIFQPARLPHAYLHGCNIELMANSDNVLRGGLTTKHVDVDELLRIVDVQPVRPEPIVQIAIAKGCHLFQLPTDEFHLLRVQGDGSRAMTGYPVPAIALNLGAEVVVMLAEGERHTLQRGESLLLPAGCHYQLEGADMDLFVAW